MSSPVAIEPEGDSPSGFFFVIGLGSFRDFGREMRSEQDNNQRAGAGGGWQFIN